MQDDGTQNTKKHCAKFSCETWRKKGNVVELGVNGRIMLALKWLKNM